MLDRDFGEGDLREPGLEILEWKKLWVHEKTMSLHVRTCTCH